MPVPLGYQFSVISFQCRFWGDQLAAIRLTADNRLADGPITDNSWVCRILAGHRPKIFRRSHGLATSIADDLAGTIGREKVVTQGQRLADYRGVAWGPATTRTPLSRPVGPPAAAILPASIDDVVATVRWACHTGTPVIPYGAGTGVHAGAAPLEGSVVLDLGAMQRIHQIDQDDRTARVEPGVLLGTLSGKAAAHGLIVGHDPWSQPIASVGGAISTNGVGYLAGKYGSMGEQVLGLEVVLGTGEVLRTSSVPKSSTGPMLRHLFIGGEGAFGIITRAEVRLFPIPEKRSLRGYLFPRFEDGLEAVMNMLAIQLRPSMIDYEEDEPKSPAPLGQLSDAPSEMYLAFEGFAEEVDAQTPRADSICMRCRGKAMTQEQAQEFWDTRHQPAERYLAQRERRDPPRQWRPTSSHLNVGLPASAISTFRHRAARELAPYRLAVRASGIWGLPELFSVRLEHQDPADPGAPADTEAGTEVGLRIVHELGGSMEYCHGVGLRLAHLMGSELGNGLQTLRAIKHALDPEGILNPGKLGL